MILTIAQVLDPRQLKSIQSEIATLELEAGSSGWAAAGVKRNHQAAPTLAAEALSERLATTLATHPVFALAARPKRVIGPLISRYGPGDRYGAHVDDPVLDGARADLAFTLFLTEPACYEGGDLTLQTALGEDAFKLPAGDLVLYPATTLHHVDVVSQGVRWAAVGWVRSLIRRADHRELLFDLDRARQTLFVQHGKTAEFDLLTKCAANLVRQWCED